MATITGSSAAQIQLFDFLQWYVSLSAGNDSSH